MVFLQLSFVLSDSHRRSTQLLFLLVTLYHQLLVAPVLLPQLLSQAADDIFQGANDLCILQLDLREHLYLLLFLLDLATQNFVVVGQVLRHFPVVRLEVFQQGGQHLLNHF